MNNLNKHAEDILEQISNEVTKVSCRRNTVNECVIQLNNDITFRETNKRSSLQATTSKAFQSTSVQIDQIYSSNILPIKTCETHDVSVQMSLLHTFIPCCQNDWEVLAISYFQDNAESLMTTYCQDYAQDLMALYCIDSAQELVISPDISYHFETCEEKNLYLELKNKNGKKEQVSW